MKSNLNIYFPIISITRPHTDPKQGAPPPPLRVQEKEGIRCTISGVQCSLQHSECLSIHVVVTCVNFNMVWRLEVKRALRILLGLILKLRITVSYFVCQTTPFVLRYYSSLSHLLQHIPQSQSITFLSHLNALDYTKLRS